MMPVCGFKTIFGRRCERTATENIGRIVLPDVDTYRHDRKPWEQTHYLCEKHQNRLLELLGLR